MMLYIGPGAGFAFLGSFLTILGGLFLGLVSLLMWPFRRVWAAVRGVQGYKHARIRKLIFLGLDGFDPTLAERYMSEGKLPNLSKLKQQGGFTRLRTTFPALSPVAWSTFATGVNPARHSMFDFLNRSLRSYMPELSSSRVMEPQRIFKVGKYRIPLSRPIVEMRRKSRTFWQILGERHITSTILRVPITFPPEKFHGRMLSAMCTPDLLGTQGTFALYTTRKAEGSMEQGNRYPLTLDGETYRGEIEGPANYMEEGGGSLKIPLTLQLAKGGRATFEVCGERHEIEEGEYTPWITLEFKGTLGISVKGIARFLLTESGEQVSLYSTPIQIDPENPALPISHPSYYAAYLAKLLGTYATLGMAEDTWALNEHAIDSDAFLKQSYLIFEERRAMFLSALERTRRGVVACVFDTTDRVQHMFFAQKDKDGRHGRTIEELYRRADELVGEAQKYVDEETVLMVLSDHGFTSFERGVDLNAWLLENGYLAVKEDASGESYLKDVDWSCTRAYTFGLAGIYLNIEGRESGGIVKPAAAAALKREIAAKLSGIRDAELDRVAIAQAWPSDSLYKGPYLDAAPDLIVGYAEGYRASWDAAVGKVGRATFTDNEKAWSGDHCVDPRLVPGVLFCNRAFEAENPGIEDMAPTALDLFGVEPPPYMEGKALFRQRRAPVQQEAAA
ncbi:MAG TPA: alkaline phosphatase family protein [Candidatus Solibacter sp.]|nr:alkaline phosphatase family protein [Candidatus Solibacter sp.]